jgi:hypothetical protein
MAEALIAVNFRFDVWHDKMLRTLASPIQADSTHMTRPSTTSARKLAIGVAPRLHVISRHAEHITGSQTTCISRMAWKELSYRTSQCQPTATFCRRTKNMLRPLATRARSPFPRPRSLPSVHSLCFCARGALHVHAHSGVAVTCMDARIDTLAQLGLHEGDAHIIRNAGGVA